MSYPHPEVDVIGQNSKAVTRNFNLVLFTLQSYSNKFRTKFQSLLAKFSIRQAVPKPVVLLFLLQTRTAFHRFRGRKNLVRIELPMEPSWPIFEKSSHIREKGGC